MSDLLYLLAADLLDAATTSLTDPPDRRFVSPGLPALDCCPQLTVHPGPLAKASALAGGPLVPYEQVTGISENLWSLVITITRCTANPTGAQPPPAALLAAIAAETLTDVWDIWNGIQDQIRSGILFHDLGCKATSIGPAVPLDEQGGCVGWTLSVGAIVPGEAA